MITVIGDVHNKIAAYNRLTQQHDYSIQIGDMGWDYHKIKADSSKHKFFGGNHENYPDYAASPHSIGDYGEYTLNGITFFFVRGAFSIDYRYQQAQGWWFKDEELTAYQGIKCVTAYAQAKPDIVLTHTCPTSIAKKVGSPSVLRMLGFDHNTFRTNTGELLQILFETHQPKHWIFGHFHKSHLLEADGTVFQCLPELGTTTI